MKPCETIPFSSSKGSNHFEETSQLHQLLKGALPCCDCQASAKVWSATRNHPFSDWISWSESPDIIRYMIYIYIILYIYHIYNIYIYQISRVILKAMTKFLETKIAASQWSAHLKCQKMCISASFYIQPCNEEHGWQVLKLNQIETSVIKALRFKRFGFVACHNAHQARDCMIQLPHDPHVSGWSRAMKYLYPEFPLQIITA